ncbi:MAG: hypothetical protein CMF98_05260 [Candidatus Marinimicrobia bacterium]|nr:hypothetical protein [Candidatus Neomarinimicrobiota bacterium]OUW50064.1 MAG: hypothetical protein CBD50_03795 [bacterium TMED190]
MNHFIIYQLIFLAFFEISFSQEYLWPTKEGKIISSNFGEPRPRRFHAGIDIISKEKNINHEIFAVEDGYIQKIKISSNGYGKVIYQKLIDGNIIIYAHLSSFNNLLNQISNIEQEKNNSYEIEKFFDKNEFLIKKGDLIGYLGETGGAYGPHLHFEIRDSLNRPINPLLNGFGIIDKHRPIPNEIALTPLDKNSIINGHNLTQIFNLKKKDIGQYEFPDTIHVYNKFGISLKSIDKINGLSWKYNITGISLNVNDVELFRIEYDKYDFKNNHLEEITIDNSLRRLNDGDFHRLFLIDNNLKTNFIKNNSNGILNLSQGYHNVLIKLFDHNNNISTIKGTFYVAPPIQIDVKIIEKKEDSVFFQMIPKGNPFPIQNFVCYIFNKKGFPEKKLGNLSLKKTKKGLIIELNEKDLNNKILQFIGINKFGAISEPLNYPYEVIYDDYLKTDFQLNISHLEKTVIFEISSKSFLPHKTEIKVKKDDVTFLNHKQLRPGVFHTSPLKINELKNMKNITFNILSNPKRELIFSFEPSISTFSKSTFSNDKNCNLIIHENTFYDTTAFWIRKVINNNTIKDGRQISDIYQLNPFNIPLKDSAVVKIKLKDFESIDKKGIFYYDKKEGWTYLKSKYDNKNKFFETSLFSLESVVILEDTIKPIIKEIFPGNNGIYKSSDVKEIKLKINDELSGIYNKNQVDITLDSKKIFFDYHPIKKTIKHNLINRLTPGNHEIIISAKDNVGNITIKKINFDIRNL